MKKKLKLAEISVESFVTDAKGGAAPYPFFSQFCFNTERNSCQQACDLTLYPVICL